MGKYTGKTCRISSMLSMTLTFFVVEIVVGYMNNSLALIADSFHMLSDVVALIVGLVSVRFARRGRSKINTFGWARAEVVGAMVNAVFLLALCFTILVDAIQRLVQPESIDDAMMLLIVGGVGLLVNVIGLFLFHDHAHGHSHGGGGHTHSHSHTPDTQNGKLSDSASVETEVESGLIDENRVKKTKQVTAHQLNMRGVFLHVLGDALGSVIVMISAGLTMALRQHVYGCHIHHDVHESQPAHHVTADNFTVNITTISYHHYITDGPIQDTVVCEDPTWVKCIDPILSVILVMIILSTSLPLLKQSASILLQTVPTHLTVHQIEKDIERVDDVIGVHELHIWSLSGSRIVASVHVKMRQFQDYINVAKRLKSLFHNLGIHSLTIQPEFIDMHDTAVEGRECVLECGPDLKCHTSTCCHNKDRKN